MLGTVACLWRPSLFNRAKEFWQGLCGALSSICTFDFKETLLSMVRISFRMQLLHRLSLGSAPRALRPCSAWLGMDSTGPLSQTLKGLPIREKRDIPELKTLRRERPKALKPFRVYPVGCYGGLLSDGFSTSCCTSVVVGGPVFPDGFLHPVTC